MYGTWIVRYCVLVVWNKVLLLDLTNDISSISADFVMQLVHLSRLGLDRYFELYPRLLLKLAVSFEHEGLGEYFLTKLEGEGEGEGEEASILKRFWMTGIW